MSSKASDPTSKPDQQVEVHHNEREELAEFAKTLGEYRDKLMAAGFKRGEAQQLVLHYQELRMIPVSVQAVEPPTDPGKGTN